MRLASHLPSLATASCSGRSLAPAHQPAHAQRRTAVHASRGPSLSPQVRANEVLKDLLEAPDLRAAARHNVPNFSEEFFLIASGLMEMARKEKNSHVVQQLETVLRAAMEEKQKTLRPEIQLLNALLAQQDRRTRKRMMQDPEALKVMALNNGYFEGLVNRMLTDVTGVKGSNNANLARQLQSIKADMPG